MSQAGIGHKGTCEPFSSVYSLYHFLMLLFFKLERDMILKGHFAPKCVLMFNDSIRMYDHLVE